jgi:MFS family permease
METDTFSLFLLCVGPPECRGTLLVLEEFCIVLGIVIAYWITFGTRYMAGEWSWRLPFLLQMIPGFILAAGVIVLPFSPRWLASKGRNEEALQSLSKLRNLPASDRRVRQEYMEILVEVRFHQEMNVEKHPKLQGGGIKNSILLEMASWADVFKKGCWRRTHIGIGIMFFQQFVGINALIYYSPSLFKTMGFDTNMQLIMSGILNVLQLVGVTTSVWTMDTLGRRKLLLGGSVLMAISHIVIAILVGLFGSNWEGHRTEGWVSAAFLLLYMVAFGATWGPVPWAVPSGKLR